MGIAAATVGEGTLSDWRGTAGRGADHSETPSAAEQIALCPDSALSCIFGHSWCSYTDVK